MVENRGSTAGADKNADAGSKYQRFGMIDFNAIATDQLDDVRFKRRSSLECADRRLKMLECRTQMIPRMSGVRVKKQAKQTTEHLLALLRAVYTANQDEQRMSHDFTIGLKENSAAGEARFRCRFRAGPSARL